MPRGLNLVLSTYSPMSIPKAHIVASVEVAITCAGASQAHASICVVGLLDQL